MPDRTAALPGCEALVRGMMSFRGQLLPLLSLRGLLGFAPASVSDAQEKIVVTSIGGALAGLVVDRPRAVVSADPGRIDPVPPVLAARTEGEARIRAIYRGEEGRRLISILAPEQLFREDVMKRLGSGQRAALPRTQNGKDSKERKFLVFRLGDDEFGLPIEAVDEVARVPDKITRVPKTPKFLEGVFNLRGEVLPVVDQRRRIRHAQAGARRRPPPDCGADGTPSRGAHLRQRFGRCCERQLIDRSRARADRRHHTAGSWRGQSRTKRAHRSPARIRQSFLHVPSGGYSTLSKAKRGRIRDQGPCDRRLPRLCGSC